DPTYSGRIPVDDSFPGETALFTWTGLANGDDGAPVEYGAFADRSVQITGTFGAGGTVLIEGSNNGTNWTGLTDAMGDAIAATGAGIWSVTEVTRYLRPRVSAGDGT